MPHGARHRACILHLLCETRHATVASVKATPGTRNSVKAALGTSADQLAATAGTAPPCKPPSTVLRHCIARQITDQKPRRGLSAGLPTICARRSHRADHWEVCRPAQGRTRQVLHEFETTKDDLRDASSGKTLTRWVIAAVMAWSAHQVGSAFVRMEAHMEASITLKVQSEAHGAVGPDGVRRSTQVTELSMPSR